MSEKIIRFDREDDGIPKELKHYFKIGLLKNYVPPDPRLQRVVPEGIDPAISKSLKTLSDYLSLPMFENAWPKGQDNKVEKFRRSLSLNTQEAFLRNRIRNASITVALLYIGEIEKLMPGIKVPGYTSTVEEKIARFINEFMKLRSETDPESAKRKALIAQLDTFVFRFFNTVVKSAQKHQS